MLYLGSEKQLKKKANKVGGCALLLLSILTTGLEANGQACGYSFTTLYVEDHAGNTIHKPSVSVRRQDPNDDYNPHFKEVSKTYWDETRKAQVFAHGLCGSHRDVLLIVSAEGFEAFQQVIDLPLGWQAFALKLKRMGTTETPEIKSLSCSEQNNLCVKRPFR